VEHNTPDIELSEGMGVFRPECTSPLPLPDPKCTPGSYNANVTQSTINSTICVSGWTATIRPSTSYTNKPKAQGIIDYGYADTSTSSYEEDHLVPLEPGGNPTDPANLCPGPYYGSPTPKTKDGVETRLKNAVCAGDRGAAHPVQLGQCGVRQAQPQVDQGDQEPVGEHQPLLAPRLRGP